MKPFYLWKMKTFLQLFILITFSNHVFGIELCNTNEAEMFVIGSEESSIEISCDFKTEFSECSLVKENLLNTIGSNQYYDAERTIYNQSGNICQFELYGLNQSGKLFY